MSCPTHSTSSLLALVRDVWRNEPFIYSINCTGLSQAILSAACARVGLSVLHVDASDRYGNDLSANFTLADFLKWLEDRDVPHTGTFRSWTLRISKLRNSDDVSYESRAITGSIIACVLLTKKLINTIVKCRHVHSIACWRLFVC